MRHLHAYLVAILSLCLAALPAFAANLDRIGAPLNHPWGMDFLDDATLIVTEKRGKMFKIDLGSGARTEIQSVPPVFHVGQGGLLDVITPQDDQGRIYYCYARDLGNGGATTIETAFIEGDQLVDQTILFTSNKVSDAGRHFGCRLEVTDKHLYASLGDRGARHDAQAPQSHSGAIIRLNRDGTWPENKGLDSWQPELFTKGQRNPQGMALNPVTGDIWTHEHGPRGGDEINIARAGKNYGWPEVTFGEEYSGGQIGIGSSAPQFEDPIWVWVPSIAPSGMAFYQGDMFPDYNGQLLVGSLKFKSLYLVKLTNNLPTSETVIFQDKIGRIRDVAVAPDGSILILTDERSGGLYRLSQ